MEDPMQYVMLVRVDPDLPVPEDADAGAWAEEGDRTGIRVGGGPAEDPDTATTVRVRDGAAQVEPGPVSAAREAIVGYDLLRSDTADAAVAYAGGHPVAAFGAIEVREVWEDFVGDDGEPPEPVEDGVDYLFVHVPDLTRLPSATPEETDPTAWVREIERRRRTLGGHRLRDEPDTSTVLRRRDGELLVTRGPFAELAEQVAGIDLVRAADLDDAIAIAAAHPTARTGAIEIRPLRPA
jgi:hypothetical protein